ncbi:SMP-30/gluconolactonase/LRE family protein [Oxalobacteraceae bacterium R-40]|uniref:SMP-30/gluconolactonase/LRE family protein n=1 Tax=Keguizhuia sedimenti TaxID=3064264 RepID=A0ABU1BTT5_9BURK|nr:SMP-30/gluconolactonase/LRE family protein [Oxalobacteraceae bacterium R-40]
MSTDTIEIFHDQPMLVGECPLWCAEENSLYWIDIPRRMLHRKNVQSFEYHSWALPSEPGCIALHEDGGLVVAMRSGIAVLDTGSGDISMLAPSPYDSNFIRFNDGRCDAKGRFWMGTMYEPRDQVLGELYCLEKGRLTEQGSPVTVSNGLAFSNDSRTLYHADTTAHSVYRYDFDLEHGTLSKRQPFVSFSSDRSAATYGGRPDGAAVDSEGAYWVAMFEGARLLRYAPDGLLLQEMRLPVRCPTMIAFGGSDLRTLFITSASQNRSASELSSLPLSGCVLSLQVTVPGVSEHRYAR